jgi:hypothetical protein
MRKLKTLRADLGAHLAAGMNAKAPALGAQVNPPAVIITSSPGSYVAATDYCTDHIEFNATLIAPAGDLPAVADALDDMIDTVRTTCRTTSPAGVKYQFVSVGGYQSFQSGDADYRAVTATIAVERNTDA